MVLSRIFTTTYFGGMFWLEKMNAHFEESIFPKQVIIKKVATLQASCYMVTYSSLRFLDILPHTFYILLSSFVIRVLGITGVEDTLMKVFILRNKQQRNIVRLSGDR